MKEIQALPDSARRGLVGGAVLLVVIAAAVNISHTYGEAKFQGQEQLPAAAISVIPDIMLVLSVMRLRYHRRAGWAWAGVVMSVLLIAWSALQQAGQAHGTGGMVMSLVCLLAAIVATGQAHVPHGGESVHILVAHAEALGDDAVRSIRAVHERGVRALQEAHEAGARLTARIADLEAAQAHGAPLVQVHEQSARTEETAGRAPSAPRTKAARNDAVRLDDVAHRKQVRAAYEASVRDGKPLENKALACALFDVDEPDRKQIGAARARASEWKRALAGAGDDVASLETSGPAS